MLFLCGDLSVKGESRCAFIERIPPAENTVRSLLRRHWSMALLAIEDAVHTIIGFSRGFRRWILYTPPAYCIRYIGDMLPAQEFDEQIGWRPEVRTYRHGPVSSADDLLQLPKSQTCVSPAVRWLSAYQNSPAHTHQRRCHDIPPYGMAACSPTHRNNSSLWKPEQLNGNDRNRLKRA